MTGETLPLELDDEIREAIASAFDSNPLALVEVTRVEVHRFVAVPWEFAASEGEGFESIDDWRQGHRRYYATQGVSVDDDDLVVCTWFRLVDQAEDGASTA